MRRIKSYNESKDGNKETKSLWGLVIQDSNGMVEEVRAYENKMEAANEYILRVNEDFDKDFEPYYEDGGRLFIKVEHNEDFEKAQEFMNDVFFERSDYEYFYDLVEIKLI